jgi:hypothetical protein
MENPLNVRTFAPIALLALSACAPRAVVHVETAAPNAVAYLLDAAPPAAGEPTRYLQRTDLPGELIVPRPRDPHWLYVTAPAHATKTLPLEDLDRKETNRLRVTLEQTGEVESLK